jgi:hypothetical protein
VCALSEREVCLGGEVEKCEVNQLILSERLRIADQHVTVGLWLTVNFRQIYWA